MSSITRSLLFFVLILGASARGQNSGDVRLFPGMRDDPLYDVGTYQRTRDITLTVAWRQVPFRTVLRDLTLVVRTTHPVHASINFRFSDSASESFRALPITFAASNMPLYEVLENLSQQAGFTLRIHRDLVEIMPLPSASR